MVDANVQIFLYIQIKGRKKYDSDTRKKISIFY